MIVIFANLSTSDFTITPHRMKKEIFSEIKQKIYNCVELGRLRQAFQLTRSLSEGQMAWEASDRLLNAEESYRRLLSYAVSGAEDPARDAMTADIGETILTVTDLLERNNESRDTSTLYYNTLRYQQGQPSETIAATLAAYRRECSAGSLLDIAASGAHTNTYMSAATFRESLERKLFALVWVTFPFSRADAEALSDAISQQYLPQHVTALLSWALLMGGLEFFDPRRMELLCDLYTNGSGEVSAVALIGLLILLHRWRRRRLPSRMADRLAAVRELPQWKADLRAAYMELTRTRDTERISAKIRDEIVPGMMKLKPEIERKFSPSELNALTSEEMEENPEWHEMLEKSGIADRLKEMSEIQEEGGDVMMATFAHLKQFPFFNEISNWFLPFHCERSEFADIPGRTGLRKLAETFEDLKFLCDSDKYSLLLSLGSVPASQRDLVLRQINHQADQFNEMKAATLDLSTDNRRETIRRQVQNLYRFFRLFRRKGEFPNPFSAPLNLATVPALSGDVRDPEVLSVIAEFYFSHGYMTEAVEVFRIVEELGGPSAQIYQKMGHALMKTGDTRGALDYFEKADMLDNRSAWTIARLARCYAMLGEYSSALVAYERLEELRPDKPSNALAMGRAHLALGHYPEAVKAFYKAFYLDEKSGKALRPLAWSLLMDRQFDQSRRYYEKIITDFDPQPEDYLNLGHLNLVTGHFEEASNFYRLSILSRPRPAGSSASDGTVSKASIESFLSDMKADTPALIRLGISAGLIPLITDSLMYSLS